MSPSARDLTELKLSEAPAVALLRQLGYTHVDPDTLEAERGSFRETILLTRLAAALKRLNPWLSEDNVQRAMKALTHISASTLTEAGKEAHERLCHGTEVEQDLSSGGGGGKSRGKKSQPVRFVDFDDPSNNELLVAQQYKVLGTKKHIIPDVMVFLNGVPIAVIECKSPTVGDSWRSQAIDQLRRYQEAGDKWRGEGAPKLFHTVQLLVATCGERAAYGTLGTPKRFFLDWKSAHPRTPEQLEALLGRAPTAQDTLLAGIFEPANLLDILRNFQVFEAENGREVRKVCRYKQFIAVNRALERVTTAAKHDERGGVVWHTQGSGKSLTMLWLALKLRRDPRFDNPAILIVTDRRDLDSQIASTFTACGFPNPDRAGSIKALRELLREPTGKTVMTTVQKFQEAPGEKASEKASEKSGKKSNKESGKRRAADTPEHPEFSQSENIFVLVDEAHRTQYKGLAANLRTALPRACFFGFTGTPIDKKDKSTLETFGPYIDKYTIEQAVADGATVPIFYEGRMPELRIIGQKLDTIFDRVFADRSEEEREAIKKKYANEAAIAKAPRRVEEIVLDLMEHFKTYIQPNGFKAQIVAVSREAAVVYKETLDRLHGPESAVIMSGSHNDEAHLAKWAIKKEVKDQFIARFKTPGDPLAILIVCDMLLTGFDCPEEQVMYLDSPLKEHNLLQAIARVNRCADNKSYGLLVDYWGVSENLKEALKIFSSSDVQGTMAPKTDELPRLLTRRQAAMRTFAQVDPDDLHACVTVLEPEDVRADFDLAFRRFAQSMDMLLPDPRALKFKGDLKWLGKVRQAAKARFHDERLDISDCGAKVRELIEQAVQAEGIRILVKQVPLFSTEFDEQLEALGSTAAKASQVEHAIRHEIHIKLEENPAFYTSLKQRLEQIIELRRQNRIDDAEQLELFTQELMKPMQERERVAADHGLTDRAYAIKGVLDDTRPAGLVAEDSASNEDGSGYSPNTDLASLIDEAIEPLLAIEGWRDKDDVKREMRKKIKRQLRASGLSNEVAGTIAASIVRLAQARR